ncbi:MAG TPA: hypothetical protein VM241_01770 [Candidatus Thermoplasmatota archaeon]|nr:hypothetical protein [Candidatus Thermoplasmatota archaeon]
MEDAELRVLQWLADHERERPGKPVKDTDLVESLGLDYGRAHSTISGLRAIGLVEARDFHTSGLGYYMFAIKLTFDGWRKLDEDQGTPSRK